MRRSFHWPLWSGLALAVIAFVSYFSFFSRFAVTRDVPWASFLLFAVAAALLIAGWRRAPRKILASIVVLAGALVLVGFALALNSTGDLPLSPRAPAVGERAPDFALPDTSGRPLSLAGALRESGDGVLLIFYRGYW